MKHKTSIRNLVYMKQPLLLLTFLLFSLPGVMAQTTRALTLEEAVQLGIANSKQLKQSKNKIDAAMARVDQAKDAQLPSAKVNLQYIHALMLTRSFQLDGLMDKPLNFPFDLTSYIGTLAISEPIFAGNQLKYARRSANLLVHVSQLDAEQDKEDVTYSIIGSYINYHTIIQNQQIVAQNMQDVDNKLTEITKYENQGLATKNDVLRFSLQKSQMRLTQIELENNRIIANYNMNILLGLPDSTVITLPEMNYKLDEHPVFADLLMQAQSNRKDLNVYAYHRQIADLNIKKIQGEKLPTLAATAGMYYVNPNSKFFPDNHTYLAPATIGLAASWDIASLYKNKNKVKEAQAQQQQVITSQDQTLDDVKKDVNQSFIQYLQSLEKIKVLQDAVAQAEENERITESKFKNNLVNTTDRIDAQTMLYQSRVNIEIAKAEATVAYYNMLKSTGNIHL